MPNPTSGANEQLNLASSSRSSFRRAAAGVAIAAWAAAAPAAERPWIEVRTPHFVVVANTGEGTARDVGWQFEQVRYVFETLWPWARHERGRPFVVFALRGESDMRALAPKFWENGREGTVGVAVSAPDKDYVALQAGVALPDNLRTNPYFYAYWGYANRALEASFPVTLPPWYQRGFSDLFGNTLVRGKDVHVGRLIEHHLRRLGEASRVSLPEMLAADWKSKYVTDDGWRRTFDAEAWMFVHYLVFGENGALRPKLNRYAEQLRQGRPSPPAFAEAFGELAPLASGFSLYISRQLYGYVAIKADLNIKAEGFAARALSPGAAAALRAGFHAAMDRPREARALLEEVRRVEPSSVLADEVEALLLDREGEKEKARAAYARASDRGSESFYVHYRRASLMRQPGASKEALTLMAKELDQAVRLNPDHAWAHGTLARVLSDLEPGTRAIEEAKRAVALEPSVAAHRLALTGALWSASRSEEARREAQSALALAADESDRKNAQEWIDFMNRPDAGSGRTGGAADSTAGAAGGDAGFQKDWMPGAAQACEAGHGDACAALAAVYQSGDGAPKDVPRALLLFEKACTASELKACVIAAYLKLRGHDVPKDEAGAKKLAAKACSGGEASACQLLKSMPR